MRGLLILVGLALAPGTATADPLDEFGFGTRAAATAGSSSATAIGADAAHVNPAGVALAPHPAVLFGYGYGAMQLDINGRDAEVLDAHGTSLGMALPLELGSGVRAAFGLALYLPDQFLARIQLIPPTEPHFVRLDNDPHRLVADPVVSLRLGRWLAIGAGASLLADARGSGINFNVGVVSGEKVGESALDVKLPLRTAPLVGVLIAPEERVRAGLSFRGELALDIALDILANVDVAGVVSGDALISVRAVNYFTPRQVVAGIAADVTESLTASAQLGWADWSAAPSGVADLRVLVALDVAPPLVQTDVPPALFTDTITPRLGAEYTMRGARTDLAVRAGYAYLPSPVPEQTGLTSFADNDRHLLAAGVGVTLADWQPILTRPIELGLAVQWHNLRKQLTVKDARDFPGEAFSSGGNIVHATTSMTVSF
ncbi:MAG TPA: outer membrane protein transport protein [Kofleriaceae bacterium]|nr:outer membrane protein transport protein [Kofleriaceae bacterium]